MWQTYGSVALVTTLTFSIVALMVSRIRSYIQWNVTECQCTCPDLCVCYNRDTV